MHLYKTILKSSPIYHLLSPSSTLSTGLTNIYGHIHLINLPLEFLKEGVLIGAPIHLFRNILTHSLSQSPLSFPLSLSPISSLSSRMVPLQLLPFSFFLIPSFFSITNCHPKLFNVYVLIVDLLSLDPSFSSPFPPSYYLPSSAQLSYSSTMPHLSLLVYLSYYPPLSHLLPRPNLSQRRHSNGRLHFLRDILVNAVHFLREMIGMLHH